MLRLLYIRIYRNTGKREKRNAGKDEAVPHADTHGGIDAGHSAALNRLSAGRLLAGEDFIITVGRKTDGSGLIMKVRKTHTIG